MADQININTNKGKMADNKSAKQIAAETNTTNMAIKPLTNKAAMHQRNREAYSRNHAHKRVVKLQNDTMQLETPKIKVGNIITTPNQTNQSLNLGYTPLRRW